MGLLGSQQSANADGARKGQGVSPDKRSTSTPSWGESRVKVALEPNIGTALRGVAGIVTGSELMKKVCVTSAAAVTWECSTEIGR